MNEMDFFANYLKNVDCLIKNFDSSALLPVVKILREAKTRDATIFMAGNGGSAAICSHLALDLSKNARRKGERGFKVQSLTESVPLFTAWANDTDFSMIFVGQLETNARAGDVLLIVSSSGNSSNVVKAAEYAKRKGLTVVSFTGFDGGKLKQISDYCVHIKMNEYGPVEDVHALLLHAVAFYFKQENGG